MSTFSYEEHERLTLELAKIYDRMYYKINESEENEMGGFRIDCDTNEILHTEDEPSIDERAKEAFDNWNKTHMENVILPDQDVVYSISAGVSATAPWALVVNSVRALKSPDDILRVPVYKYETDSFLGPEYGLGNKEEASNLVLEVPREKLKAMTKAFHTPEAFYEWAWTKAVDQLATQKVTAELETLLGETL